MIKATLRLGFKLHTNIAPFKEIYLFRIRLPALNTRKLILKILDKRRLKSAITVLILKAIHCTEQH
jgi:hypothetical protein